MLNLRILITDTAIDAVKHYLWNELPSVKSSHRLEGVARGFGFNTYAAMLHSAKSSPLMSNGVDATKFSMYLRDHGFEVEAVHLYRTAARVAVSDVLAKNPRLSIRGYGIGQPGWDFDQKRRKTPKEEYSDFLIDRSELLSKHALNEFLLAFALVQNIPPTQTVREAIGSYRLKHIAENMPYTCNDGTKLGPQYVSNGALIAAALHAGFRMKTYVDALGWDHINVSFNMSKRAVDDLDCELRPYGPTAQDRARLAERRKFRGYYGMTG